MATYAIGDLQGCLDPLKRLLDEIAFEPARDRLLFVGDLINRGPDSLGALRFVHALGPRATTVLGNHDLHLLAVAFGGAKSTGKDTLDELLAACDADELLSWLRSCPIIHREAGHVVVHAGLAPEWTVDESITLGNELSAILRGPRFVDFLRAMYGDRPNRWDSNLEGFDRARFITNAMTRLRFCTLDGELDMQCKTPPGEQPEGLIPWFEVPGRKSEGTPIVFGHWASLQANEVLDPRHGVIHVDSGCVWSGAMTAYCLESGEFTAVDCP